ncbi:PqiC family protein [Magnetococcales bacterium HHB-1]
MKKTSIYLLIMFFSLTGCVISNEQEVPPRFYLLTARHHNQPASDEILHFPLIEVSSVRLPDYLKSSRLVGHLSDHEIFHYEDHQWAEGLTENIGRVVEENIANQLAKKIKSSPQKEQLARFGRDKKIQLEILRFSQNPDETVTLNVFWRILDAKTGQFLLQGRNHFQHSSKNTNNQEALNPLIQAMSHTLSQLSNRLTDHLLKLNQSTQQNNLLN